MLAARDQDQIGQVYRLKQEVAGDLRRRLLPQRDHFPAEDTRSSSCPAWRTASASTCATSATTSPRSSGELHRQIDDLAALTSTYFNANANRLNRLLTRLTVMGTFFLVWTLVTSFFGQNFGWLVRHINSFTAFALYQALALLVPTIFVAIYFWRRRSEWL